MGKKLTTARLLLGLPTESADLRYVTGFSAPDPVVCLHTGRARYLVVPALEYGRAKKSTRGVHVLSLADLGIPREKRRQLTEWALALLRLTGVRAVDVHWSFPLMAARRLQHAGIRVNPAAGPLFPERAIKSRSEVARIREVQQAAVIAMRAAIRRIENATVDAHGHLRDGSRHLDSQAVRRVIDMALLDRDCLGKDTIVAGGPAGANPHERGDGPLSAGESIVIDIFPQHRSHGYWGDLTRTVCRGVPPRELVRMYQAVRVAQQAALRCLKPGVCVQTVHRTVQETFQARGFETRIGGDAPCGFIHGTGHGVGLDIHEAPSVSPGTDRLRAGNVITIEPGLYYPEIGGVRIEDTVLITPTGWRYIFPCEKKFVV